MIKFYAFIACIVISLGGFSQDLIVTTEGDSINCQINAIKKNNFYFTFKHKAEIRETFIPTKEVVSHQKNYYSESIIPVNYKSKSVDYSRVRFGLDYGYSHRTAKVSPNVPRDLQAYVKDLKRGFNLGADLHYFVSEPVGIGIKYVHNQSSNSLNGIYIEDDQGNRRYGTLSDDITITFVGVSLSSRVQNANKTNAFLFGFAMGKMNFRNNFRVVESYVMTGSCFGTSLDLGYDIATSKNFAIGVKLSLIGGVLTNYVLNDGFSSTRVTLDKSEYESLSRIDLSVGIRFIK